MGVEGEKPPIPVLCGVIFDSRGRILAARRGPGRLLVGKWEFPGGKWEPDEEAAAGLRRELREELGIEVEVGAALTPVTHCYEALSIRLLPFCCRWLSGTPTPTEHTEIRWLLPEGLPSLDWAAADEPIVREVVSRFPGPTLAQDEGASSEGWSGLSRPCR